MWINPALPANWQGSAIVDGSEDLSVVVRNDASGQANLDNGFLSAGVVDPAFAQPATTLYAPAIYINIFGGFNSAIYLQNPNKDPANVTLNFVGRTGYGDFSPSSLSIPANGSTTYFVSGGAWVGSLRITAGQPIVAKIIESQGGTVSRSYSATAAGKALLYVPAAYKNYFGFNSGIVIQNLHASSATNVTVTYCDRLYTSCFNEPVVNLAAQKAYGVNIGATTVLPASWTGSVKIQSTSSVPLAIAVTNSNSVGGYDFSATDMGSKLIVLPRAAKAASGRTTGYTVRNVSGQNNVVVTAYYYNSSGGNPVWTRTFTLHAGQVDGYFQSNDTGISNGWEGTIVLEATQPVTAIMREDTASTTSGYNGIPR